MEHANAMEHAHANLDGSTLLEVRQHAPAKLNAPTTAAVMVAVNVVFVCVTLASQSNLTAHALTHATIVQAFKSVPVMVHVNAHLAIMVTIAMNKTIVAQRRIV